MGARAKRICRVADTSELGNLCRDLDRLTTECHQGATFHNGRRDELTSVWFATPFMVTRDSEALEESNWQVITKDLKRLGTDGIEIHSFGHWGCGWYERLYVRRDDVAVLRAVQRWINALADYPVADEDHYSSLEWERNHPSARECYADDCCCEHIGDGCENALSETPGSRGGLCGPCADADAAGDWECCSIG